MRALHQRAVQELEEKLRLRAEEATKAEVQIARLENAVDRAPPWGPKRKDLVVRIAPDVIGRCGTD